MLIIFFFSLFLIEKKQYFINNVDKLKKVNKFK